MSDKEYRIVFDGQIGDGFTIGSVKKNMAQLFKADDERIAAIFSGQPVVLKRNLDEATARKYVAALRKAGAVVTMRQSEGKPPSSAGNPDSRPTAATQRATEPRTASPWTLAPTGSELLRADERTSVEELELDLSHLSLASIFATSEQAVETTQLTNAPDTSHLSVAEVGSDLAEKKEEATVEVADLDASLAPLGADLQDQIKELVEREVDTSHLSLS